MSGYTDSLEENTEILANYLSSLSNSIRDGNASEEDTARASIMFIQSRQSPEGDFMDEIGVEGLASLSLHIYQSERKVVMFISNEHSCGWEVFGFQNC
jgi:hypothetical protein